MGPEATLPFQPDADLDEIIATYLKAAQAGAADLVSGPPADPWPELYDELDRLPEPFQGTVCPEIPSSRS